MPPIPAAPRVEHHRYGTMPTAHFRGGDTTAVLYCAGDDDVWGVGIRDTGGIEAKVYTTRAGIEAMRDTCNAILDAFPDIGLPLSEDEAGQ